MRAPAPTRSPPSRIIGDRGTATDSYPRREMVANAILRLANRLDMMGLALIFELGPHLPPFHAAFARHFAPSRRPHQFRNGVAATPI
jgi:hypothetical protein